MRLTFGAVTSYVQPFALALSFMHCKNVTLREEQPVPGLSKAHERRHGAPLVKYTTLDIDPMRQVLRTEGEAETNGLVKALHICRGHFKDYTEKGLFGRLKGKFWWPSTVRGSADAGVVDKTYNVKGGTS